MLHSKKNYFRKKDFVLHLNNLTISTENQTVIKNLTLTLPPGTLMILKGSNGSGKSSLALTIMGHPKYTVTQGTIQYQTTDITVLPTHERAQRGIFLALQQPYPIAGVSLETLVREAYRAQYAQQSSPQNITEKLHAALQLVGLPESFAQRSIHEGASGGERKRIELAQMIVLEPSCILLDEIDSGVDAAGLDMIKRCIIGIRALRPQTSFLVITHNENWAQDLNPESTATLVQGSLVQGPLHVT